MKGMPAKVFAGVIDEALKVSLEQAFGRCGHIFHAVKNWKKAVRLFPDGHPGVVLVDQILGDEHLYKTCQAIRKVAPKSFMVALQNKNPVATTQAISEGGYDLVLNRDIPVDKIVERVLRCNGLGAVPPLEGRAQRLRDRFESITASWPKLGEKCQVHEGIMLQNPKDWIHPEKTSDLDVGFVMNGQIGPYLVEKRKAFWTRNEASILSAPDKSILELQNKLLIYHRAPPVRAAVDREGRYFGPSHYCISPGDRNIGIEDLCCLMNSRMMDFYFHTVFVPGESGAKMSSSIRSFDLKQIPLPPAIVAGTSPEVMDRVKELELLLHSGAGGRHDRVLELKQQLDEKVFEWFGLNAEDRELLERLHF